MIREIKGHMDFICPGRDPNAVVVIDKVLGEVAKPIENPTLKSAKIEIMVLDKPGYEKLKAEKDAEVQEKLKEANAAGEMGDAMASTFSRIFSNLGRVDESAVVLHIVDPDGRLAGYEFQDAEGKPLKRTGTTKIGKELIIPHFSTKPAQDTRLRLVVATEKATVKVPINFTNVPLP
jgi:hypothetical protein